MISVPPFFNFNIIGSKVRGIDYASRSANMAYLSEDRLTLGFLDGASEHDFSHGASAALA